jgi:hypothetical protein
MIRWRPFALAIAAFVAFLMAAEWGVSALERSAAIQETKRQAEAWGLHVSSTDQELRVTVQKPREFGAGRLAVTDLVAPRALVDSIGLAPQGKWAEVSGSPYATPGGEAIAISTEYVHWRGEVILSHQPSILSFRVERPSAASGTLELRYVGDGEMCPAAGSVRLNVGGGAAVPVPTRRYPDDPLAVLSGLC